MTPKEILTTMHAAYVTALGEADVDVRILQYVDALILQVDREESRAFDLECRLEDAEELIRDLNRGAVEND
jgi:tRNA U54 and U55 pseudouridine synthase Pus10